MSPDGLVVECPSHNRADQGSNPEKILLCRILILCYFKCYIDVWMVILIVDYFLLRLRQRSAAFLRSLFFVVVVMILFKKESITLSPLAF